MIIVLAYCAVLLSFASGLLALLMNQQSHLLAANQFIVDKYPNLAKPLQNLLHYS